MTRYRKKPVVIEAWRFQPRMVGDSWRHEAPPSWLADADGVVFTPDQDAQAVVLIKTLEGTMRADPGDWIIKGVAGELYPCKPDIFAETYEAVE